MIATTLPGRVASLEVRQTAHEQLCAERQQIIIGRLDRLERVIMGAAGALILALGSAILLHARF